MAKKTTNFYGSSIKKGGLHRALDVPEGKKIPVAKLAAARNSKDPHMRKMANFATNAKKFSPPEPKHFRSGGGMASLV
jgi:hypothetical protein